MKNIYTKQNNSILNAGALNISPSPRAIAKLAFVFIFFIQAFALKAQFAQSLNSSPVNSRLTIVVANNTTNLLDKTVVGFNPNSTDSFNTVYDANKLPGLATRQTLYTWNSGEWMSINILPSEATIDTVSMGMEPGSNANFTFSCTGINTFDSTSYVYIEDKKTHTWADVRKGNYSFNMLTTDDWNRFLIHFTPPVIITEANTTCAVTSTVNIQQPGMAYWNYVLADTGNNVVANGVLNHNLSATLKVLPGDYNLILSDTTGYTTTKSIHVTGATPAASMPFMISDTAVLSMQPITLTDSVAMVDSAMAASTSYQWNFGNGTLANGTDTTISYTTPGIYTLSLTATNIASGCTATQSQQITVTAPPPTTTDVASVNEKANPDIWSNQNRVYADFENVQLAGASVAIYNILGQEISYDHISSNSVYQKELDNVAAAYMIVKVVNNHQTFVKKVFISNK
jgi:PKD domain